MKRTTINKKLLINNKTKRKNKRKVKSKNKRKTNKKIKGGANNPLTVTVTSLPDSKIHIEDQVSIPVKNKEDNIHNVMAEEFGKDKFIEVYFGGDQVDSDNSFEEHGIKDGARLEVTIRDRFTIRQIITDTLELNQHLTEKKLKDGVIFNEPVQKGGSQLGITRNYRDGGRGVSSSEPEPNFEVCHIKQLNWSKSELIELPPSFCDLIIANDLNLSFNALTSLPENFGSLSIGGNLELGTNKLTSLPESFGSLTVGGELSLFNNNLESLPKSFCNLRIKNDLLLHHNKLTSLPENFGDLTVDGYLNLSHNKLELKSLPENFGNLTVGGNLYLMNNNDLTSLLPESFTNVHGSVKF